MSQDPEQSWDDLVRYWEEMDWPEGSKVEIIEGIITLSPAPAYRHNVIAESIQRRLYPVMPEDWGIYQTPAIAVPSRVGMLIPDLVVAPRRDHTESDTHIPAALAELVVEVTSKSNAVTTASASPPPTPPRASRSTSSSTAGRPTARPRRSTANRRVTSTAP
ncbi:hypothetical protein GCM10010294_68460 [Streptomyces griseoloalbus]|nr:hypothetical protein GCM10010294_68460 [Streptomyces griseoloalbus]